MEDYPLFELVKDNGPELEQIVYEFSNSAYQYYHWLGSRVLEKQQVLTFNQAAMRKMKAVSVSFANTAVGIDQYFENRDTTKVFLASIWDVDEAYRTHTFAQLLPDITFGRYSRKHIESKIERLQNEAAFDPNDFVTGIREEYGGSLELDVQRLLATIYDSQDEALKKVLPDIQLSTAESTLECLQAGTAQELKINLGQILLHQVVDDDFVQYIYRN